MFGGQDDIFMTELELVTRNTLLFVFEAHLFFLRCNTHFNTV